MTHDDTVLKKALQQGSVPPLPASFVDQALQRLQLASVPRVQAQRNGTWVRHAWLYQRKWWWLGLLLVMALAWQHQRQSSIDDELLHVDTLSMSSLSVL